MANGNIGLRRRSGAVALIVALLLSLVAFQRPVAAAEDLCFNQPGVTACVAKEFRDFWERNGGLGVFGYPLGAAKQEQTPEGSFLVQYFERQRLEWHPEMAAPANILLGRINDEVLKREGRDWRTFARQGGADCMTFAETGHSVCGAFLARWRSIGLDLGDPGVSARESLWLWGLPLSAPMMEINFDGDQVLTQHFERARFELHGADGGKGGGSGVMQTRLGVALVPLNMKILAINDFHGQISAGRVVSSRPAGGAAVLAAYIKQRRALTQYSLTVHAGDMIGASAPSSALLQDQPTMDFLNRLGVDVGALGNHELDEGPEELMRLLKGGCHQKSGCWNGTNFPYISSNVIDTRTGKTLLPSYVIKNVNGARIGFIGATLMTAPEVIIPSAVANLRFLDEATEINKVVKELNAQGVHAIVVLIHQGGFQTNATSPLTGPIVDIVNKLDADVDVVVSGHTHAFTNATVNGKLVTQAFSYSTGFADIDITIDRARRDIVAKKAEIVTTFADGVTPDPAIAALVKGYEDQVAPQINRKVGTAAANITAVQNEAGESALGNLIADGQRSNMQTQFAFMNPGGIRAPIDAGDVTWGELFAVQPFSNDLVKMTLTGAQIYELLNQQWQTQADGTVRTRFLQISGLSYTWADANPIGQKVVEVRANGQPIDRNASYTATVNIFLSTGGDGFTVLTRGTNRVPGPDDLAALVEYVEKLPQPFNAAIEGRIVKQ